MKVNVCWMYPDNLNLHGDKGNIMALTRVADYMGIDMNVMKIYKSEDLPDLNEVDLLYFGAGMQRDLANLTKDLMKKEKEIREYTDNSGFAFLVGTSGCLFAKTATMRDGSVVEGLDILEMNAKELNRVNSPRVSNEVYGDDILWKTADDMEIIGCQIQLFDYFLDGAKSYGNVIYGYGNNCRDNTEGAVSDHVYFTNTCGPILANNPWLTFDLLEEIAEHREEELPEYDKDTLPFMGYARRALEAHKTFIKDKKKPEGIQFTGMK